MGDLTAYFDRLPSGGNLCGSPDSFGGGAEEFFSLQPQQMFLLLRMVSIPSAGGAAGQGLCCYSHLSVCSSAELKRLLTYIFTPFIPLLINFARSNIFFHQRE